MQDNDQTLVGTDENTAAPSEGGDTSETTGEAPVETASPEEVAK